VLSETADVFYKCDEHYNPSAEGGLLYSDPDLGIDWQLPAESLILSERDRRHPRLSQLKLNF
jgi:dTDP-4-dehydrorhamnose 3,5-epimerase